MKLILREGTSKDRGFVTIAYAPVFGSGFVLHLFFLRQAARVPKNPPAAVSTQIVAVTAISLVVSISILPRLAYSCSYRVTISR